MLGSIIGLFGKNNKNKNKKKIDVCYVRLPNSANKNITQDLKNLNSKIGQAIDVVGIEDRDCRKNWFTGKNMMFFSIEHILDELDILARYRYLFGLKVTGGGGSGAIDYFFYEFKKRYRDSPIPIIVHIATELVDIRSQINSAISLLVNLKLREKGTLWLFSNSKIIKDCGTSLSLANRSIANLIWCLAYADHSNITNFDLSLVSKSVYTGKFAELPIQPTSVEIGRNIIEKVREMLSNPWIDRDDFIWDNSKLKLVITDSIIVCLVPEKAHEKLRIKGLNVNDISTDNNNNLDLEIIYENNNNTIKTDYVIPGPIRNNIRNNNNGSNGRELIIHIIPYPGKTIKIVTLTKIAEESLEKCERLCEEFLKRLHDDVAVGDVSDPIKSTYRKMFEEEFGTRPRVGEYPWEELCRL